MSIGLLLVRERGLYKGLDGKDGSQCSLIQTVSRGVLGVSRLRVQGLGV